MTRRAPRGLHTWRRNRQTAWCSFQRKRSATRKACFPFFYIFYEENAMTTRSLVDPELAGLLDTFPALHLTKEVLPQIRAAFEETMKTQPRVDPPEFAMISVSKCSIPGPQGAP